MASKSQLKRRAAGARKAAQTAAAQYVALTRVDAFGGLPHPAIVRVADGQMVPCTHRAPFRGEPVIKLAANWLNDGDMEPGFMKPLEADVFARCAGCVKSIIIDPAVIAAAAAAFAVVDAA